jgi:hypothetical protein
MGYDSNECIKCYSNNPCKYEAVCCMTCLDNITVDLQDILRVTNCFREWENGVSNCEFCYRQNCFSYMIPLCKSHMPTPFVPIIGENLCADVDCSVRKLEGNQTGNHCSKCDRWYCEKYLSTDYEYNSCSNCGQWYCGECDMIILLNPGFVPPICKKCDAK